MRKCIDCRVVVLNSSVVFNWYTDSDLFEAAQSETPCPLEQSWKYGDAIAAVSRNDILRARIEIEGRPAGTLQVAARRLPGGLVFSRLTRGPVIIQPDDRSVAFSAIHRQWRRRTGKLLLWMPDIPAAETPTALKGLGKRPMTTAYATAWLDLTPGPDDLRRALRGNWRSALAKAEAVAPTIHLTRTREDIEDFLAGYLRDKRETGYHGPPERLVRSLFDAFGPDACLVRATDRHDTIAAALFLRHGRSATYFLSWTTPPGRECNAAQLLMWTAIEELRTAGVAWLDLGGLDARAPGVARFKLGLGAAPTAYSGTWF